MEDSVFPSEAVASFMKDHVVESRLHTDLQGSLTDEQFSRNRKLQDEIADGSTANPYFVMVDAASGKPILHFALSGYFSAWPDLWMKFLEDSAKKIGRTI
jgi:hypothetical protein